MKVLLIGNYPPDDQRSMLAFTAMLERELPHLNCEVRVLCPQAGLTRLPMPHAARKWAGYVDKFILFRRTLRRHLGWADVVHVGDHSNAMYLPVLKGKPNVITCHDVLTIQAARGMIDGWQVRSTGRVFQSLIAKGLGQADFVACASHLTERDLLALKLADPQRVLVIPNGLNNAFAPVPWDDAQKIIAPLGIVADVSYLMHIGLDLFRKNRQAVLEAFIALQHRAVAAGRPAFVQRLVFVGPALSPEMQALAQAQGVAARIQVLPKVSHEELCALYSRAAALLFPSLQEGFGWPVIEAQACGCPVITSDLAPMNEIGGEGAIYVNPHDAMAIAQAIEEAVPRMAALRAVGLDNATHYSARQMASNYRALYQRAMDARKTAA